LVINRFVPPSSPRKLVCKWVKDLINVWTVPATVLENKVM
jgi:hypothetical protein